MVSSHPLISKSSSPFINSLVTVPRAPITIGIIVTFMSHSVFNSLAKSRYLSFFSLNSILLCDQPGQQSPQCCKFSFFFFFFFFLVDPYKVWSSGWDYMIRLYVKIPEEFVHLILQLRFWVVHIPFVCMVRFQFLAQFPVDLFAHPVMSNLLIMWLMLSSLSPHNLHLLFCCVLSILALIWLVVIVLCCYQEKFSFS